PLSPRHRGPASAEGERAMIVSTYVLAAISLMLVACSSAPPRPVDQPAIVSEYKSWTISVTPSRLGDFWRARVRVWPPEVRPEARPGIDAGFSGPSANRNALEQAATTVARQYIDASSPTRPQSSSVPAQIPADEPPIVSQYKGWTISVTPSSMQDA